jgi:hypothetical protein
VLCPVSTEIWWYWSQWSICKPQHCVLWCK